MRRSLPTPFPTRTHISGLILVFVLCSCGAERESFNEDRAYSYLVDQCEIGPRFPGSPGAKEAVKYFHSFFNDVADTVILQLFQFTDTIKDVTYSELTNVIARFQPGRMPRVLLCAHWDTRPFADLDPDSARRNEPILGANDGASGCAVLMEVANTIANTPVSYGVDIVLFDCEDYGDAGHHDYYSIGSKHFSSTIDRRTYAFGILLDMIGDSSLAIYREMYSEENAKRINDLVWSEAARLGINSFRDSTRHAVYDDHIPLLQAGIPAIDIIDFDYPYWHTLEDTPDKCSAESLGDVGKVLVALLSK